MAQVKERGGVGKKGRKRLQINPSILKTTHLACHAWRFTHRHLMLSSAVPSFPSPSFIFWFSFNFSLATQATHGQAHNLSFICMRIERRRMTSCYHGSTIFGGKKPTTTATARRTAKKNKKKKKTAVLHGSSSTWFQTSRYCRAELNS